jgi:ribosomal protein L11 methyltransferase
MPTTWQCLRATLPREALDTLGLEERPADGAAPVVRQPWDTGPAPEPPARVEVLAFFELDGKEKEDARVSTLRRHFAGIPGLDLEDERLSEGDWVERWRTEFRPFEVAPGVMIAPPWDAPPGAMIVDPGMAFGTGEHPTTRACLRAIHRRARAGASLLDVGCGSGILALLGAFLGMRAEGVDVDPTAVRAAHENAERNGLRVPFDTRPVSALRGPYDLVAANLFAEEIARVATDLRRLCGGALVVAGILLDRESQVIDALGADGVLRLVSRQVEGEWVSLEWERA